jgi:hypothetical protein
MLMAVATSNASPQNPPQAVTVHGLHPIPLCLRQRPRLTTINEMQKDKIAKNLHIGRHRKVAIPPHMGKLHKSAQPTRIVNINLLLQVGMGVDNASQILEKLHQLHRATTDVGVSRQLGGTPAH